MQLGCGVATAPIRLLAWELPHATGVAVKRKGKKKSGGGGGVILKRNTAWEFLL